MAGENVEMTEIPEDLYARVCAFIRTLAESCKECHRPKTLCCDCDLQAAPYLLSRLNNMSKPNGIDRIDYGHRFDIYEQEIRNAQRPLLAKEIDPKHRLCGRGLKYWSLRKMIKLGIIRSFKKGNKIYFTTKN